MNTVVILSVSSDIGAHLAKKYLEQGDRVIGTYRSKSNLSSLTHTNFHAVKCDVAKTADIAALVKKVKSLGRWDTFISCVGHPLPVVPFFEADFDEWSSSVYVNSIAQL